MAARLLAIAALAAMAAPALAAEIVVLCPGAVRATVVELAKDFERTSGHKVRLEYGTAGAVYKRAAGGEAFDAAITTAGAIDDLVKQGRITATSKRDVGSVGVGVAVRAGAPQPDISTSAAFRQSMLSAQSVMYADPAQGGQSGIHTARVFEKLGIAEQMKPKTQLRAGAPQGLAEVAKGDIELGLGQVSEIVAAQGVTLVGPFPSELQNTLTFSAGVGTAARAPAAAQAFVSALVSNDGRGKFRAAGFDVAP